MASKDSKGRDFAESIRSKVNTIRDDSSRVAKKKDVIKGQQPYLKDAIELVYGEYKASSQSKNSKGVSLFEEFTYSSMSVSDKAKYGLDKINDDLITAYTNTNSCVMHRGEDYHLLFTGGKIQAIPAGDKHFETMEDLVVAQVVGKITDNDTQLTSTKKAQAFTEYNTLKAKL